MRLVVPSDGARKSHAKFRAGVATRNRAKPRRRNGGRTASAARRSRRDSVAVNQNDVRCPDSCQMISGTVLAMTALQTMKRGNRSERLLRPIFIQEAELSAILASLLSTQ